MSVATEIQRLQAAKADLKTAIEEKGVTVPASTKLDGYADLVEQISGGGGDTDGLNGFLSVESKTIATSASQTTNITYNKNCGILDENYKKWDTLAWHQRWVDNGYSATGLSKPIGIWMNAYGMNLVYLWRMQSNVSCYDVSGTSSIANTGFSVLFNVDIFTSATAADRTVWPANGASMIGHGTAGKYKSDTWRAVNNGDGLDLVCLNTNETFTIPNRNVGNSNAFTKLNSEDYVEAYYQECEFLRALFAICSGIACPAGTEEGETTTVEILNINGQQPAVNEDMYFWIGGNICGGTANPIKARYNRNCKPSRTANVTTSSTTNGIIDAIYAKQIAAGINMNDTGVNSSSKHVLCEGAKGAEAIAVGDANNRYWYIKTPYISNPNSSTFNSLNNVTDSNAAYICKHKGVSMLSDYALVPYWLNKSTHITALVNLLRTIEDLSTDVPDVYSGSCWSAINQTNEAVWTFSYLYGTVSSQSVNIARNGFIPTTLSSTQFTT